MQINIKDEAAAGKWLQEVKDINQDYFTAMKEAGHALQAVKDTADGTLVDELVNYGTTICNVAQSTFNVVEKIADTVTKVVNKVKEFSDNIVDGIRNIGKMFG
jgi:predicted transcriptional regulator